MTISGRQKCRLTDLLPIAQHAPALSTQPDVCGRQLPLPPPSLLAQCSFLPLCHCGIRDESRTRRDQQRPGGKGLDMKHVCDHFREATGIELQLKEVLDCENLILAFFSNWEAASITSEKLGQCRTLILLEMKYTEDVRPFWFLDCDNFMSIHRL